MTATADIALSGLALVLLARTARTDFETLRIPNRDVALLVAVTAPLCLPALAAGGWTNLVPALLLFGMGIAFWLAGAIGAGDAKLFFPVGILVGWHGVAVFALALLPWSALFLALARAGLHGWLGQGAMSGRLAEIGRGRGIPYAVPMALAAGSAVLWRLTR